MLSTDFFILTVCFFILAAFIIWICFKGKGFWYGFDRITTFIINAVIVIIFLAIVSVTLWLIFSDQGVAENPLDETYEWIENPEYEKRVNPWVFW